MQKANSEYYIHNMDQERAGAIENVLIQTLQCLRTILKIDFAVLLKNFKSAYGRILKEKKILSLLIQDLD